MKANALRRLRFIERHWDGSVRVGPIVLTTDKQVDRREENAFRLGVDAGAFGLVKPSQPPPTERPLHSV
jgi:hypothetical protein